VTIIRKAPWNERNGRFSQFKAVVFAGLFVPASWVAVQAIFGWLGPKPVTEMIHRAGDWGLRFLLLSLLITPLIRSIRQPKLIAVRRMIGVAAFAYISAHLSLYVVQQDFDIAHVASEIALRFYLTIGFVTWLGLAALAATSTDAMIKRLGGPRWSRLHKIVYALAAIGLLHYYIQSKADVSDAVMMTGFFFILMLFRVFLKRGAAPWAAAFAGVAVAVPLTALTEATWYALIRHIDFWEVLAANIDPDMIWRPSAYVAGAGLVFVALALWRRQGAPARRLAVLAAAK
jgi:sulfoxide reductase heme-binding subunit YedZ